MLQPFQERHPTNLLDEAPRDLLVAREVMEWKLFTSQHFFKRNCLWNCSAYIEYGYYL